MFIYCVLLYKKKWTLNGHYSLVRVELYIELMMGWLSCPCPDYFNLVINATVPVILVLSTSKTIDMFLHFLISALVICSKTCLYIVHLAKPHSYVFTYFITTKLSAIFTDQLCSLDGSIEYTLIHGSKNRMVRLYILQLYKSDFIFIQYLLFSWSL